VGLVRFDVLPLDGLDEAFLAHHLLKVNQDDFALLDRSRLVRGVDPDVGDEQVGSLGQRRPRLALDDLLRDQALGHHHCAEQFLVLRRFASMASEGDVPAVSRNLLPPSCHSM